MTHFLNLSFPIALLQAIHKPRSIAVLWLQSGSTELTASGWLAEAPLSIPLWNFPLDPVFCCSDTYWWGQSVLTTRSLVAKPSQQPLPGTNQMFLLFWSKFHTTQGEVLHGLDCNTPVASRPEQRSLQQEEMALYVQASHSAINQLMALGSKSCKATSLGMLYGTEEAAKQPACLCFPLQSLLFFWRNNYCQEVITLMPPQSTPWWLGEGEWKPEPPCLVLPGQGFLFQWKVFSFQTSVFSLYSYLENFSFS